MTRRVHRAIGSAFVAGLIFVGTSSAQTAAVSAARSTSGSTGQQRVEVSKESSGGWLGVAVCRALEPLRAQLQVGDDALMVENVATGGPADRAGIERFDVIVKLDGKPLPDGFPEAVKDKGVGAEIELTVIRHGKSRDVRVKLEAMPPKTAVKFKYQVSPATPFGNVPMRDTYSLRGKILRPDGRGGYTVDDLGKWPLVERFVMPPLSSPVLRDRLVEMAKESVDGVGKAVAVAASTDIHDERWQPLDLLVCGEYLLLGGNAEQAVAAIDAAISRGGTEFWYYKSLGWALLSAGRKDDAKKAFRKAADETGDWSRKSSVQPDGWTAAYFLDLVTQQEYTDRWKDDTSYACMPWFYVGQRTEIQGERDKAIAAYRKSVELGKQEGSHYIRNWSAYRLGVLTGSIKVKAPPPPAAGGSEMKDPARMAEELAKQAEERAKQWDAVLERYGEQVERYRDLYQMLQGLPSVPATPGGAAAPDRSTGSGRTFRSFSVDSAGKITATIRRADSEVTMHFDNEDQFREKAPELFVYFMESQKPTK